MLHNFCPFNMILNYIVCFRGALEVISGASNAKVPKCCICIYPKCKQLFLNLEN